MKRTIVRSVNKQDHKCKTYVYSDGEVLVFVRLTLIHDGNTYNNFVVGDNIVRDTCNYTLTRKIFSIQVNTVFKALEGLGLHSAEDISELIEIIKKNTIGEAVDKCIVAAVGAYAYSCKEDRIKNIVKDLLSVKTELL
jgi:hypothetical protein